MAKTDTAFWGIHAGRTGDADTLFLEKNCIAIGWTRMGDLSGIKPDRESFKAKVAAVFPEYKPAAVPGNAGQLFRFVHEMKSGDWVIYPSKRDRMIHIGQITGEYKFDTSFTISYPNRRAVKWVKTLPRTGFSQGALYEIGSALSLFMVKNYVEEFRAAVEGKSVPVAPLEQDDSVAAAAEDIEQATRDFILKRLAQDMKGLPLEDFIVHLLQCMGYQARKTRTNEPSVDIIAHKDQLGIEPPIIKVQVKSGEGTTSDKDVSALYGKLSPSEYGLFITLGAYSTASLNFEQGKANLRLIDGQELVDLILQNYERFDARHKGMLPLRRVYVPEAIQAE